MNEVLKNAIEEIGQMGMDERIAAINEIKQSLKKVSPFTTEPVECVQWVRSDLVIANDYNPNSVAPPEMELLHTSIQEDGYTQPIVVWQHDGIYEVVDGFHNIIHVHSSIFNPDGVCFEDISSLIMCQAAALDMIGIVGQINLHFMIDAALLLT